VRLIRETKRLAVFESGVMRNGGNCFTGPRRLYVMLPKDESIVHMPMPLVTALVLFMSAEGGGTAPFLDWLETATWLNEEWGQKLRDRMVRVLLKHLPELEVNEPERMETVGGPRDGEVRYIDTAVGLMLEGDD
jgi:hypothetical protein